MVLLLLGGTLVFGEGAGAQDPSSAGSPIPRDSLEPISKVRVDANGDAVPDRKGDTVAVAGRIVAEPGVFSASSLVSLQDETGGVHLFLAEGPAVERGDSVVVRGVVQQKYGLTQLRVQDSRVVEGESRIPAPLPLTVTSAAGETYEGKFTRVRGRVARSGSNEGGEYLILSDRSENASAQISIFVPNRALGRIDLDRFGEGDEVEVTGVLGQFDYSEPYTGYYQVIPREASDLSQIGVTTTYLRTALFILLGGGILAVVAVVMLRAAVKRRTQELAESRARFRRLAEATFEGIILYDDDEIIDTNEALAEMVGRDRESLIGQEVEAVLAETTRDLDVASFDGRANEITEVEMVREDGSTFPVEIETRTVTEGDRTVHVAALRNISTRKEWEEQILRAKQEAEEAARLKSSMLANMSHEIRTPLTSIIGFSEVLKDNLDGDMETFAQKAYNSSQRLMKTLDSVLQLSKLEAGTLELDHEPTRLDRIAEETVNLLRPKAEEKSIALHPDVPERAVEGYWNQGALNRIADNLVGNAIKFTPEGGSVFVRVRCDKDEALLEVEDTGVGIDEDTLPRIFMAFKQESEGLGRKFEGSGLGLSIVRRLVEAHGGTIAVETEKGEGSTFIVKLPLYPHESESAEPTDAPEETPTEQKSR